MRQEIDWIDLLVGGCYRSLPSFETFSAFTAWYFIAAIQFERAVTRDPSAWTHGYLNCENLALRAEVENSFRQLRSRDATANVQAIREGIRVWNDVGLLEPITGQRIPHTAPPKYAKRLA
jgi:tetracycline 7-halogenase / FADH2 O2-dependent halogenase